MQWQCPLEDSQGGPAQTQKKKRKAKVSRGHRGVFTKKAALLAQSASQKEVVSLRQQVKTKVSKGHRGVLKKRAALLTQSASQKEVVSLKQEIQLQEEIIQQRKLIARLDRKPKVQHREHKQDMVVVNRFSCSQE